MSGVVTLRPDAAGAVMRMTLDRPEKNNAIDAAMIRMLTDAAVRLAADRTVRVVVLDGAGKHFCAGGDLGWMRDQFAADEEARLASARALAAMLGALDRLPQLLIGITHGAVMGGGVGLAAVCDIVIAARSSRFSLSETRLGLIPATIAPFVIARIGAGAMRRIGLTGPGFGADEAVAMGLATEAVEVSEAEAALQRHLVLALAAAPDAVAQAKRLYREIGAGSVSGEATARALAARWGSAEAQAGIAAFFAKEDPPWRR